MAGQSVRNAGGRRQQRRMAEINVAPLVDVMLVLLIISLLAAPVLQRGIALELPETETATEIRESRIVVSLDRNGRIRINDRPVHETLLEDRMRSLAATRPSETVYLRADKQLPYGEVLRLMDRIRKAGVTRVGLVTVPVPTPREDRG